MNEVVLGTETLVDGNKEVVWRRKTVSGGWWFCSSRWGVGLRTGRR